MVNVFVLRATTLYNISDFDVKTSRDREARMKFLKAAWTVTVRILAVFGGAVAITLLVWGIVLLSTSKDESAPQDNQIAQPPVEEPQTSPSPAVMYTAPPVRRLTADEYPCSKLVVVGEEPDSPGISQSAILRYCRDEVAALAGITSSAGKAQHLANEYCQYAAMYNPDPTAQWYASVLDNIYGSEHGFATVAYPNDKTDPQFTWHQNPHNADAIYFDGGTPSVQPLAKRICESDFVDPNPSDTDSLRPSQG